MTNLHLITTTDLDRAEPIVVRELGPADRAAVIELFEGLSDADRYYRFLRPMPSYPPSMVRLLTAMDGVDHIAVGAIDPGGRALGVARFVRYSGRPDTADLAVTVAGAARGRGLARRLIEAAADAAGSVGIVELTIDVHPQNRPALALFRSLGFELHFDDGTIVGRRAVESTLDPEPAALAIAA